MGFPFMILSGVLCAAPIRVDLVRPARSWTENDQWVLTTAMGPEGCRKRFEGRSPCLRRFYKLKGFQAYYVECAKALRSQSLPK